MFKSRLVSLDWPQLQSDLRIQRLRYSCMAMIQRPMPVEKLFFHRLVQRDEIGLVPRPTCQIAVTCQYMSLMPIGRVPENHPNLSLLTTSFETHEVAKTTNVRIESTIQECSVTRCKRMNGRGIFAKFLQEYVRINARALSSVQLPWVWSGIEKFACCTCLSSR